jgi:hypothetical protein
MKLAQFPAQAGDGFWTTRPEAFFITEAGHGLD